jgi:hypothetical protein
MGIDGKTNLLKADALSPKGRNSGKAGAVVCFSINSHKGWLT